MLEGSAVKEVTLFLVSEFNKVVGVGNFCFFFSCFVDWASRTSTLSSPVLVVLAFERPLTADFLFF